MALRWCAAGMVEAGKQFRRVNGHLYLPALRATLERETAETVGIAVHNDQVSAARCSPDRHRSFYETRDIFRIRCQHA
jgi:hypothetical protein